MAVIYYYTKLESHACQVISPLCVLSYRYIKLIDKFILWFIPMIMRVTLNQTMNTCITKCY